VFYDYLGIFLVFYGQTAGTVMNSIVFVFVTIVTGWCTYTIKRNQGLRLKFVILEYIIALGIQVLSVVVAILFTLFTAWALDLTNRSMAWYTNVWLIFGIYFVPFFTIMGLIPYIYIKFREKKHDMSTSYYVQMALHSHCNLLSFVLVILTIAGIKSAYLVLISTGFYFLSTIINVVFGFVDKGNKWIYLHCFGQIIPTLYYFYLLIELMMGMIPIGARAYDGATRNPEITISLIVAFFTILSTGFYAPIFLMFKHRKYILAALGAIFIVFLILVFTPVGFPYAERQPQRYVVWHTKRDFHDYTGALKHSDSGYYVHASDRRGVDEIMDQVKRLKDGKIPREDCEKYVRCGQPWWRPNYYANHEYNLYIPAEDPALPTVLPRLVMKEKRDLSPNRTRFDFSFAGPHSMQLQMSPLMGAKLVDWSFVDSTEATYIWKNRDYFYIGYHHGLNQHYYEDFDFYLTIERPLNWTESFSFDIALGANFIHIDGTETSQFIEFVESFPSWTNVQHWSSYYTAYQY